MPRIILLRHGESDANLAGKFNSDNEELTKIGIEQARKTGTFLKKNFNITHIYTAPSKRTMQTVECLELKVPVVIDDILREGGTGILAGLSEQEIFALPKVGKQIKKLVTSLNTMPRIEIDLMTDKFKKINDKLELITEQETDADMQNRAKSFIKKLNKMKISSDILVVSHNGFIREILAAMFNINQRGMGNRFVNVNGKAVKNCHISVIDATNHVLELMLSTDHLQ